MKYNPILEKINSEDLSYGAKNRILSELLYQESEELFKTWQKQIILEYESLAKVGREPFGKSMSSLK